jgi:hypothetical protein
MSYEQYLEAFEKVFSHIVKFAKCALLSLLLLAGAFITPDLEMLPCSCCCCWLGPYLAKCALLLPFLLLLCALGPL